MLGKPQFVMRQCTRPACQFRFPAESTNRHAAFCPKCGAETEFSAEVQPQPAFPSQPLTPTNGISEALLDNIRSIYNVGTIFRTAEGAGFRHLYLCGITPTPDHPKLTKTALGAESCLTWTYAPNALDVARRLKAEGYELWALEYTRNAISLFDPRLEPPSRSVILIFGNEVVGVDPALLALCDRVIWIPMGGQKESLNVAVAFGIAAFTLRFR
jgi:23S rRNA (guanosine2251-2'-O)-methyltransferase